MSHWPKRRSRWSNRRHEPRAKPQGPFDRINDHVLAAVSRGTVSTHTLTAIPIKEFYDIVDEAVGLRKPRGRHLSSGLPPRPNWRARLSLQAREAVFGSQPS
jgi:hypothetical protein